MKEKPLIFIGALILFAGIIGGYFLYKDYNSGKLTSQKKAQEDKEKTQSSALNDRTVYGTINRVEDNKINVSIVKTEKILFINSNSDIPDLKNASGRAFQAVINSKDEVVSLKLLTIEERVEIKTETGGGAATGARPE